MVDKQKWLDLAEVIDAFRVAPRLFLAFFLFLLYDVTMSAIEGDASQWLVAVVWTGMSAIFKFYVDEGRKW